MSSWLQRIGLPQYTEAFERAGYDDWLQLSQLEEQDLDAIATCSATTFLPGHRKKLLLASRQLTPEGGMGTGAATATSSMLMGATANATAHYGSSTTQAGPAAAAADGAGLQWAVGNQAGAGPWAAGGLHHALDGTAARQQPSPATQRQHQPAAGAGVQVVQRISQGTTTDTDGAAELNGGVAGVKQGYLQGQGQAGQSQPWEPPQLAGLDGSPSHSQAQVSPGRRRWEVPPAVASTASSHSYSQSKQGERPDGQLHGRPPPRTSFEGQGLWATPGEAAGAAAGRRSNRHPVDRQKVGAEAPERMVRLS